MTEQKEQYYITCIRNLLMMNNLTHLKMERSLKQITQMEFEKEIEDNPDQYSLDMRPFDPDKDDMALIADIVKQVDPTLKPYQISQLFGIIDIELHPVQS